MSPRSTVTTAIAALAAGAFAGPVCRDVSIPVNVTAISKKFPSSVTSADITVEGLQMVLNLPNMTVNGDYIIAGTYCQPSTHAPARENALQILLHGAGYTRTYWSSLGLNQVAYSWVDYAAEKGYSTLAVDRLCNGQSSHPNGLICTVMTQAEVTHQIIQQARTGSLPIGNYTRAFRTIILVGHSVGSEITSRVTQTHPLDADAVLLTGWSNAVGNGVPGVTYGGITPAYLAYPNRYANLSGDPTYLTFASKSGQSYLSYFGEFAQAVQDFDYATQGTFTLGEALTQLFGQFKSSEYAGPAFVLNGNEDATYCQPDPLASAERNIGNCTAGNSAGSASNYPTARLFGFFNTLNTGHCLNLHFSAPQSYQVAFEFLSQAGF